ncbi:AAA family ATPase [Rickettsiales endosymbiont of Peranema trichophorum]|uniref:AAA family ATPase n=1 Tax=Rickettsiales endosymbiont of Peranema trichophorum TaxID=2486577 RepID=UPI0010239D3A|nr:AAA family ATPase [Rickettsiales endosymbiont of Peranema trichophorum]RZI45500.1 AAA family ATPase [Rickettsiales endosymbiont of Peranema trichophorum]
MKLPVGVSDFRKIVKGNYVFTDKTLLIKEVMDDGADIILVTRPRRFGKTLNLSMLYYFLENSQPKDEDLFEKLNIGQDKAFCQEHQHQYPVIFISFKDVKKSRYKDAYEHILLLVREVYRGHRYLLEGDCLDEDEKGVFNALLYKKAQQSEVEASLRQLCIYIQKYSGRNPIILIDEYDTPIQEAYLSKYYEKMIELMRSMLGQALKDNSYLTKAVVTGITRISQESLFSGLNNISVYSMLRERFGQYFGFTEEEVVKLLEEAKQPVPLSEIKEWYNGYQIGKHVLYNPWSIINCLDNEGILQEYWLNTSNNALIGDLLRKAKPVVKKEFEELLQGKVITQALSENLVFLDIRKKPEALWSLLLYAGYLKVLEKERQGNKLICHLSIPNKEVSFVYDDIVDDWFSEAISIESYDSFVRSLMDGDMEKFEMYITSYIMQSGSYFDFNKNTPEQIFHVFILGLVVGLRGAYYIRSNQESGLGRFDVVMLPKQSERAGILLEFKATDDPKKLKAKAKEGLKQVKDNQYLELFRQNGVKEVLAIGLAFCGKQLCLVNEKVLLEHE